MRVPAQVRIPKTEHLEKYWLLETINQTTTPQDREES